MEAHFAPYLDKKARKLKKKVDRGFTKEEKVSDVEVNEDDGNSSFEDVDSENEKPKKKKK